jgi:hypothetical protein
MKRNNSERQQYHTDIHIFASSITISICHGTFSQKAPPDIIMDQVVLENDFHR